jgi:hypothetical protein
VEESFIQQASAGEVNTATADASLCVEGLIFLLPLRGPHVPATPDHSCVLGSPVRDCFAARPTLHRRKGQREPPARLGVAWRRESGNRWNHGLALRGPSGAASKRWNQLELLRPPARGAAEALSRSRRCWPSRRPSVNTALALPGRSCVHAADRVPTDSEPATYTIYQIKGSLSSYLDLDR